MARPVAVIACVAAILASAESLRIFIRDPERSKVECATLKQTITDSVVAAGITFFADHPRGNATFDPNSIEPFTPSVLIQKYYGHEASAVQFTEAILSIVHAAEIIPEKRADRNDMRRNLYSYINAGSYEYARTKAGALLRNIVEEYVGESAEWKAWGCVIESKLYDVLEAVEVEYYRILNEVGDVKFGQFLSLGIGSTLAFCIDDTGSMSGEIAGAKKRAQRIVEYSRGTLDAPQDFVLVPFNDPGVGPVTVTTEAAEYHKALDKLSAHGGGDWEELALRGIQLAIENCRPGSIIYVITDAPAKDYQLQDTVIAQARQKSITITMMLTNELSGCRSSSAHRKCADLYKYIASETGGKTLVIGRSDFFSATDIVQKSAKQGIVTLNTVVFQGSKKQPHHVVRFHVDSGLLELQLQAQGHCQNIYATLPGQSGHVRLDSRRFGNVWTSEVDLTKLNKSWVGEWKMGVDVDTSECEIQIKGKTTMGFVFTLYSKPSDDFDDKFEVLRGNPSVDSTMALTLDGYGMDELRVNEGGSLKLKCVGKHGNVLRDVALTSVKGNEFQHVFDSNVTNFEPFYIMVEGTDRSGNRYQRMHSDLITPSHVRIHCDLSRLTVVAGARIGTNITITNNGPKEDVFAVSASDEHKVSSFSVSSRWTVPVGGSITRNLRLNVPDNLRDGTAVPITIVARGKSKGSFQHAKCILVVGQKKRPRIDSFSVKTVINARFAETVVTSVVTNNAAVGREAEFDMLLPKAAFITAIRIELQNETIHGVIEEKKKAEVIYERAKERGTVAGHVAARDSSTRSYRTSMFVEAGQKVRFVLTYQEFLIRTRGRYEYAVILKPDQPIKSLSVDVHISEERALKFVRVAPIKTTSANLVDEVPPGSSVSFSRHNYEAHVRYRPDVTEQMKWSPKGIDGIFSIEYDVERVDMFGDIAVNDGFFAHFFAPPNLPPMPKIVVLVVDTSGSMYGYKIKQVKEALSSIVRSLSSNDKFSVIFFGDEAYSLMNGTVLEANSQNIEKTIAKIQAVKAYGGTNMEGAFDLLFETFVPFVPELKKPEVESSGEEEGSGVVPIDDDGRDVAIDPPLLDDTPISLDKRDVEFDIEYAKMAVFLTDGRASVGETNTKALRRAIKDRNENRVSIHAIGLGSLVDFGFLEKLAHENDGTSRRIFEGIDADVQIRNFFEEIANPILKNVTFEYPDHKTKDLTETTFSSLLGGSELVVAGKVDRFDELKDEFDLLPVVPNSGIAATFLLSGQVRGSKFNDETEIVDFNIDLKRTSKIHEAHLKIQNYTEKLWAFLTLKKLLLDASIAENKTEKEDLNSRALNMSLEYGLVTSLTSLIVIRPEDKKAIESQLREEAKTKPTASSLTTTPTRGPRPPIHVDYPEYAEEAGTAYSAMVDEEFMLEAPASLSRIALDSLPGEDYAVRSFVGPAAYTTTTPPAPRTYASTSRPKFSHRRIVGGSRGSSYRSGGGGFSGDPHFVIPMKAGMKLCFNFDGKTGEIYNFLIDRTRDIVVNGRLVNSPAPPDSRRSVRTYVSHLAVVAGKYRKKILITPADITIVEVGMPNLTVSASSSFTVAKGTFEIQVIPASRSMSNVTINIDGLSFKVTLNNRIRSPYSLNHIDFSLFNNLKSLSADSDGVFGQFIDLRSPSLAVTGKTTVDGETRGNLLLRGKTVSVVQRTMPMPGSHKPAHCWYLHKNGADAMKRPKDLFQISSLFAYPMYFDPFSFPFPTPV